MRAFVAAAIMVLAVGLVGSASATAAPPSETTRWGVHFEAGVFVESEDYCPRGTCRPNATYYVVGFTRITPSPHRKPLYIKSIRIALWKQYYPSGTYHRVQSYKWNRVGVNPKKTDPPHTVSFALDSYDGRCAEPLGTRYWSKVRIKVVGRRTIWLRSDVATMKYPWAEPCR